MKNKLQSMLPKRIKTRKKLSKFKAMLNVFFVILELVPRGQPVDQKYYK